MIVFAYGTERAKGPSIFYFQTKNDCREILCPNGMIRNRKGDCVYIGNIWITEGFHVHIKLKPSTTKNFTNLLDDPRAFVEDLMLTSPWPSEWKSSGLYLKLQDSIVKHGDTMFLITLFSSENNFLAEDVVNTMKESLQKHWVLEANSTSVYFEQSLLEYDFIKIPTEAFSLSAWTEFASEHELQATFTDMASVNWKKIYRGGTNLLRYPVHLDKMFLCEQVNLQENEFRSIVDRFIIKNRLTDRYMYNREFVLIQDGNGNLTARVCLSDTTLGRRESNGCSFKHSMEMLVVVWIFPYAVVLMSDNCYKM